MYKLCYLLIHLFNLCDPLCKVLHLACSPTFTFRAVSTSVVQIKKIMNAALIIINLRSRLGLKIKEQKKGKLMIFSLISQRPGLQLIPDFPSPLFLTHTHTHTAQGLEIAFLWPQAEFTGAFWENASARTQKSSSGPNLWSLRDPHLPFYPLGTGISVIEDHY